MLSMKRVMKNQAASVGELGFTWICVLHPLIPFNCLSTLCLICVPSLVGKCQPRLRLFWVRFAGTGSRLLPPRTGKMLLSIFCTQLLIFIKLVRTSVSETSVFPFPQLPNLPKTSQQVQRLLRKDWQMYIQCDHVSLNFLRVRLKNQVCSVLAINPCV